MLGVGLILHGLAHAGAGTWTTQREHASTWLLTILWAVAMPGFVAAGLGAVGVRHFERRWRAFAATAAVSSLLLLPMLGGPVAVVGIVLDVGLVLIAATSHRWIVARPPDMPRPHRVRAAIGFGVATAFVLYLAVVVVTRPWTMTWGSTDAERRLALLPGDTATSAQTYRIDHAVTIRAPIDSVWPWLVQLGQDRGGFYSYDWLERLFGDRIHNASRVHPEWQQRAVGDLVRATQPDYLGGIVGTDVGWRVSAIEPGRAMVLADWGTFELRAVDSNTTRMHVRTRGDARPNFRDVVIAPLGLLLLEPAHFIMERGMLLGIKERAEGNAALE
jgi:hypothetical protein